MLNDQTLKSNVAFRVFLNDFCGMQEYDFCENLFRDLLKSGIGEDKFAGTHSLLEITNTLFGLTTIQMFVRRLNGYLNAEMVMSDPQLKTIIDIYRTIDIDDFEEEAFRGLNMWIHFDDTNGLACLSYIQRVSCNFNNAANLLKACYELNEVYMIEDMKGCSVVA